MLDLTAPIQRYGVTPDITHVDLFYVGRRPRDGSLVTDCVLIDLTGGTEDLDIAAIGELDLIRPGNSVIFRTGWEAHRGTPRYADSPSVDRALVEAVVDRGVSLVLVDSPGVFGGAKGPEHNRMDKYLADHKAYAVENLVNVDKLAATRFRLFCFPVLMSGQNNAPCRIVADVP